MKSSQSVVIRLILRSLAVGAVFVSAHWCRMAFSHEPFLALISASSAMLALFAQGDSSNYECLFSLLRVAGFIILGASIGGSLLILCENAGPIPGASFVSAIRISSVAVGILVGVWFSLRIPSIEKSQMKLAAIEGSVYGAILMALPAFAGNLDLIRALGNSTWQRVGICSGLGVLIGGLGWPAFAIASADLKDVVNKVQQRGRNAPV
jgi:hypothetical protein